MATCAVASCHQERRYMRKELQRWGKNVLFLVGMERVAQELMGGRKWRKLMSPLNSLETNEEPQDWNPQETCYFCNSKTQSNKSTNGNLVDQESKKSAVDDNLNWLNCSSYFELNNENNVYNKSPDSPVSADQPLDLSVHSRHKPEMHSSVKADIPDSSDNALLKVPQIVATSTKTNKKARLQTTSTWKRTYTEDELQAALRDIQSGKLGTRRAAVIYGIPRSTLRNKVYKMALDRTNGKRKTNNTASSSTTTSKSAVNTKQEKTIPTVSERGKGNVTLRGKSALNNETLESESGTKKQNGKDGSATSATESLKQILKNAITQRATNNTVPSATVTNNSEINEQNNSFSLLNDIYNREALATIQMLSTLENCGPALAPLFTQFLLNIHHLALAKQHADDNHSDFSNSTNLSVLPDLIRRLAEERLDLERTKVNQPTHEKDDDENEANGQDKEEEGDEEEEGEEEDDDKCGNVILKVPSYKPKSNKSSLISVDKKENTHVGDTKPVNKCTTSNSSQVESDEIESKSVTLKQIIAKSISQRLNANSSTKGPSSVVVHSEDSSCDALVVSDEKQNLVSLSGDNSKNSGNVSDQSNPSTPEKRNRPKRGRYRNYNRDDLAKAVRAVQRGEMSVHRAGTLFGVPHSTLEYKVKERHLLRPKKRHHETSSNSSSKKEAKIGNESSISSNGVMASSSCDSTSMTTSKTANDGVNLPFWQAAAFPFFPLEVGNANFFASNMMRKLQENARMNAETQPNSSNEFSGLLLESLIKSSLEKKTTSKGKDLSVDNEVAQIGKLNSSLAVLKEISALDKKE